jgi:plastocyanin
MTKRQRKKARSARRWYASRSLQFAMLGALAIAIAVVAFYAFASGSDAPKARARQEPVVSTEMDVTVNVIDRDYEPRDLTVQRGATVTWKFKGDLPHDVVEDRDAFRSPILEKGDEWSLTFEDSGTFYYYCTLHHSMQGTLTVAE